MNSAALKVELVPLESLRLDPRNARLHGERNLEAIRSSLARFGQVKPIVVDADGVVIAGNGTLEAARSLGWSEIQVVRTGLKGVEAIAFALADNRSGEMAEWSSPVLAELLQELQAQDALAGTGFVSADLEAILAELSDGQGLRDEDEVPEPPPRATTRPGDLWTLSGNHPHRLLCGDAGSPEDLDRLLSGERIQLANCDPPYNVRVEPRSNNAIAAGSSGFAALNHQRLDLAMHPEKARPTTRRLRPRDRFLRSDFLPDDEFDALLRRWFDNLARALEPGRSFYIWGGYSNWKNYCAALSDCGLYFSHGIIWVKQHPVLTRKDMLGNFECCWHGWREGAAHQWFGPNNITDVWEVKKVNPQSMIHLTEKPVELARRAIEHSSRPGELVLDLFGGSGSTLVAAEATRRKAFLMEVDPLYCDVILARWQAFTGKEARLEGGMTFADVARERAAVPSAEEVRP